MKNIERNETFPDIREATKRYSLPRSSFSRVPLRNDEVVPVEKAFCPTDIQIAASAKIQKLSATRQRIEERRRSILATMRVFFCHQWSAMNPDGIWKRNVVIQLIPVQSPISLACAFGRVRQYIARIGIKFLLFVNWMRKCFQRLDEIQVRCIVI